MVMILDLNVSGNVFVATCALLNCYISHAVPAPTSVILTSNIPSPIRPIESDVNLTCSVKIQSGPEIDVQLAIDITLSRTNPAASSQLQATTAAASGSTHTSVATIRSFGRDQSGTYICTATVRPTSANSFITGNSRSNTIQVTTGKLMKHILLVVQILIIVQCTECT